MTKGELISKLSKYPDDTVVLYYDREYGFVDNIAVGLREVEHIERPYAEASRGYHWPGFVRKGGSPRSVKCIILGDGGIPDNR